MEKIILPEGDSWIMHGSVPKELEIDSETFKQLWSLHPEDYSVVRIYGKLVKTPRWSRSYGQAYHYSGVTHEAEPITDPFLLKIQDWVKKSSGLDYKQVLVNWYKDGQHYISAHSDDEKQLVPNSAIYSFSFGQTRTFRITSKDREGNVFRLDLPLYNNSLVIMGGEMQKYYHHEVPKRAVSTTPNPRINLTLRLFKE